MTVDRNILPGMKPTRHSFRCGQPLGPGVAHHGMRNLVHHAQAHVASPRGERLPAQVADHLSDAAYVVVTVASVPGRSALDHVKYFAWNNWGNPITTSRALPVLRVIEKENVFVGGSKRWTFLRNDGLS